MSQLECNLARMRVSDFMRYDHCYHQLYSDSEIFIRLLGQITVDTGLLNQEIQPDVKTVILFTSIASAIFASRISIPAGYRQCQTTSRALRVICSRCLIKNILIHNFYSRLNYRPISNCNFRI